LQASQLTVGRLVLAIGQGHHEHTPLVLMHSPLQHSSLSGHCALLVHLHWPLVQAQPSAQALLQAPQVSGAPSEASQPFGSCMSQFAKPGVQVVIVHVPVLQLAEAWAGAHGVLQLPQSVSVRIERSQPLLVRPSQSEKPGSQTKSSQPFSPQVALTTFGRSVQSTPQAPQVPGVSSSASQPLFGF
jgi:hypothetical protein